MNDLYKTTEEQKIKLYQIADSMRRHGLDSEFIEKAVKVAEYYEGCFEMFCLWAEEADENERMNILDCLKREIVEFDNDRDNFGCLHSNVSLKEIEKKLFDLSFITESLVCNKCGAILRGNEFEKKFNLWLAEKYINNPEKFQIDCYFPKKIIHAAQEYLKGYPGISINSFFKALVVIYFNLFDQRVIESTPQKSLVDSEVSKLLADDEEKRKVVIGLKPKLLIEVSTVAESLGLAPSAIFEEAVLKLMTFSSSQEQKREVFWLNEIRPFLDMILKAS